MKSGVYFKKENYASIYKRFFAIFIDSCVLLFMAYLLSGIFSYFTDISELGEVIDCYGFLAVGVFYPHYFTICVVLFFLYLAVLKPTEIKTLGFRIAKIKIVNLNGEKPSIFQMIIRYILLIFGPFNFIIDLFWLTSDQDRQTLRDKFAATYVINENITPEGSGEITFNRYYLLGLSLLFKEVKRGE